MDLLLIVALVAAVWVCTLVAYRVGVDRTARLYQSTLATERARNRRIQRDNSRDCLGHRPGSGGQHRMQWGANLQSYRLHPGQRSGQGEVCRGASANGIPRLCVRSGLRSPRRSPPSHPPPPGRPSRSRATCASGT